jgi:hypothetical protein
MLDDSPADLGGFPRMHVSKRSATRFLVPLFAATALVVGFFPQIAVGNDTGKLFSTRFVTLTAEGIATTTTPSICLGDTNATPLVYEIRNRSTQNVTLGSANINIPSGLVVTAFSIDSTSRNNVPKWQPFSSYNQSLDRIQIRSERNSDGVPRDGWVRFNLSVKPASGAAATDHVWGQNPPIADTTVGAFVKQSNNFSGSGNDLLPSTRQGTWQGLSGPPQTDPTARLQVKNCVDIETSVTSQPATETTAGRVVAYTVTVTNKSTSSSATNVTVNARTGYGSFTPLTPAILGSQTTLTGCAPGDGTVACPVDPPGPISIAPGASKQVKFTVTAPAEADLTSDGRGGFVQKLITDAWASSTEDPYPPPSGTNPTTSDPSCSTTGASDNYAVRCLDIDRVPTSDSTVSGYLLPGDSLTVNDSDGRVDGTFTLASGSGAFKLSATDCEGIEECVGGVVVIEPDCDDLTGDGKPDCRGLMIMNFESVTGLQASKLGDEYFVYYLKPGPGQIEQKMPMCNTDYTGGSQGDYRTGNPVGSIDSLGAPIPCLWKFQQTGSGSDKMQIQVVIDGEDPRLRV